MAKVFPVIILLLLAVGLNSIISPFPVRATSPSLPEIQPNLVYHPYSPTTLGLPPYTPTEIRTAYNFEPLYRRGVDGRTTRIAIVDAFGNPSLPSDLSSFDSITGLPPATVNLYYPDGIPTKRNSGWAIETSLDLEWAHAIAPGATIDLVIGVSSSLSALYDAISFVSNSLPNDAVVSMSFGLSESLYPSTGSFTISAFHQLFVNMVSHGTTPFASSGDAGATSCCNIQYPAADPLVVAVGGTSLTLNADASYASEATWSGSGSGSSIIYSKPSWQQGLGDTMRDTVDVSYDGDPATGVLVVSGNTLYQVGGTSAGAPQWAALLDLASQGNSARYGAVNAQLYKTRSYHDITTGSNGFFSATAGWDYPTGLGSPDANATVKALANVPALTVTVSDVSSLQGITVHTTGTITIDQAASTISGTITVTATDTTTGTTLFTKSYSINSLKLQSSSMGLQVLFLLNVAVTPYPLSSDLALTLSGATASISVKVTRQIDVDLNGSVDIIDASTVASAFGSSLGSPGYNPRADLDANGIVNILDVSNLAFFYGAPNFL